MTAGRRLRQNEPCGQKPVSRLRLEKYHGLGNDFLVAFADDADDAGGLLDAGSGLARTLCHRRRGIGADGLILATDDPAAMLLWNSDGSPAEVSGNGLRCLAHAIARRRGRSRLEVVIQTAAGPRRCTVVSGPGEAVVTAEMGSVGVGRGPGEAVVAAEMGSVGVGRSVWSPEPGLPDVGSAVEDACGMVVARWETADVGNPHIVLAVPDPDAVPLAMAGPAVEALFPGGINVEFASATRPPEAVSGDAEPGRSQAARPEIALRVWERGAGVTDACGTGAVAAAAVFRRWGSTGDHVTVRMPGGDAQVGLSPTVTLTGPSVYVAAVDVGSD